MLCFLSLMYACCAVCLCLTHTLAVLSWSEVQMLCSLGLMFRCCVFSLCLMYIRCDLCQMCSVHCLIVCLWCICTVFSLWDGLCLTHMCCVFVYDIHVLCSWSVSDARMLCSLCLMYMCCVLCVGCSVSVSEAHMLCCLCGIVCVWSPRAVLSVWDDLCVSEAHVLCCLCGMFCVWRTRAVAGCSVGRCTQIKTHAWSNASVVLAGNKCDLEESRVVSQSRGQELAHDLGTLAWLTRLQCCGCVARLPVHVLPM